MLYGEKTSNLLDDVDFNEDLFLQSHSKPYNLDYKINVRLQAISADLEDFGSHLNDAQWTNVAYLDDDGNEVTDNAGRVIAEDGREDNYEITADSTITDDAVALVTGISYGFATPYTTEDFRNEDGSVAVTVSTAEEFEDAINDDKVHSILLTDNITISGKDYAVNSNKFIDLGEYTLKQTIWHYVTVFKVQDDVKLTFKHGKITTNGSNLTDILGGTVTYVGVDIDTRDEIVASLGAPNSTLKMYNSTATTNWSAIAIKENRAEGAAADNSRIYMNNSKLIANNGDAIQYVADSSGNTAKNVSLVFENSYVEASGNVYMHINGSTIYAKGTEFVSKGGDGTAYGIGENHNSPSGDAYFEDCTIKALIPYYKAADSKLTMKNCEIIGEGTAQACAVGIVVRNGDVTLDNVTVNCNQGAYPTENGIWSEEELRGVYDTEEAANGPDCNFEAIQILLNEYENVNLNIIGGQYNGNYTEVDEDGNRVARSVFLYDNGYSIHNNDGYKYNNTITISGNPTFSPDFTFAESYKNTTVK